MEHITQPKIPRSHEVSLCNSCKTLSLYDLVDTKFEFKIDTEGMHHDCLSGGERVYVRGGKSLRFSITPSKKTCELCSLIVSTAQENRQLESLPTGAGMGWGMQPPQYRSAPPRAGKASEALNQLRSSEQDQAVKEVELAVIPTPSPRYVEKAYPISSLAIVGINGQKEPGVGPPGLNLFGSHQGQNGRHTAFLSGFQTCISIAADEGTLAALHILRRPVGDPGSKQTVTQILRWLSDCTHFHPECNLGIGTALAASPALPKRVIQVGLQ